MEATKFWRGRRVFVTGGTGFIGSHLVNKLTNLGANVKLFVHCSLPDDKNLIALQGDLASYDSSLKSFLLNFNPEIIFYLAAQPIVGRASKNMKEALDVNSRGSYLFLDECRNIASIDSIIYVSTDKVYGDIEVINDMSPLHGNSHPYNASKLMGDIVAQLYSEFSGLPITIIRHGNIYGEGDYHWDRIIPGSLLKIFYNESPIVRVDSSRDYIYIEDIVDGYLDAARIQCDKSGILNLGSNTSCLSEDIIGRLKSLCGKENLPVKKESLWKGELAHQHFEMTESSKIINWRIKTSLDDGLKFTVDWYLKYFEDKSI